MDGLTVGRIVHFVRPDGSHRAAMVNEVEDPTQGLVGLTVFSQRVDMTSIVYYAIQVPFSAAGLPNTWHWIERA